MLLVGVAADERLPVLGAWLRLRHPPAVGLVEAVGVLRVAELTVAELVLGLLILPVASPVGRWVADSWRPAAGSGR